LRFYGTQDADMLVEAVKNGELDLVDVLNSWLDELNAKDVSTATQHLYYRAVKKFFEVNVSGLTVNWKRVDLPRVWKVEEDRLPTKEEFKWILNYGTLLDRVIETFKASSGVRDNTLAGLKVGDVDLDTYEDVGVVYVKPEITKERVRYVTFISPEAKRFLQRYLDLRRRKGEKIGKDSPLIAKRLGGKVLPVTPSMLAGRWRRLLEKANLGEKSRRFRVLRFHTLRKFFRTNLELAGVSKSFRERLMGHKGEALDDAYFKPAVEQLLNEYRKAISNLTIMEEVKYDQLRKRQALDTLKLLGFDDEKLKRVEEILARAKTFDEAMEKIRRLKDEELTETNGNGSYINSNGYRAKVIGEAELIAHVEAGWDIVKELNSGKFIVRKQAG